MKRKTKIIAVLTVAAAAAVFFLIFGTGKSEKNKEVYREISPATGDISLTVSTTGTVLPKNRLELKPSVAGRIEKIYVSEGDVVRAGQILALMSSTDRAALIDAARLQGSQSLKYWENAYKPIPVVAPISGTVIVRSVEPGQTVTASDSIIIISDMLIVKAQVDETDIGRVKEGQRARISLDSHPEILVNGKVDHIYYESATVNNVTVYYVSIKPDKVPAEFRSGMSATIDIVETDKRGVMLLPEDAVLSDANGKYVLVKGVKSREGVRRAVATGIANDNLVEITSGLGSDDIVLVKSENFVLQQQDDSKNPFMPQRPARGRR
ncbi:MAG TPA: efflux RND transporter periplasmic adaptor subunit [Spirochaetota bacterium]|nr:efflux RND transporter periplasmic adaptor subunit [Spirochaetota bacterium]HPJ43333.1 efflux RND transporter periplasmic adaptor subunit [Spirochaetota bacterium]HPR38583.1 efflux RND transporter periplasmic adaptor subunit [Spirochaetota bacterium]HRX48492.1 efflux RND transporter periplasmic adaptor subunit [Spirochaetota bacterium]